MTSAETDSILLSYIYIIFKVYQVFSRMWSHLNLRIVWQVYCTSVKIRAKGLVLGRTCGRARSWTHDFWLQIQYYALCCRLSWDLIYLFCLLLIILCKVVVYCTMNNCLKCINMLLNLIYRSFFYHLEAKWWKCKNLQRLGDDSSILIDYNLVWMYTIVLSSNRYQVIKITD